jgi:hypothetical protein
MQIMATVILELLHQVELSCHLHVSVALTPGKRSPGKQRIRSWVCPSARSIDEIDRRRTGNPTPISSRLARSLAHWAMQFIRYLRSVLCL